MYTRENCGKNTVIVIERSAICTREFQIQHDNLSFLHVPHYSDYLCSKPYAAFCK